MSTEKAKNPRREAEMKIFRVIKARMESVDPATPAGYEALLSLTYTQTRAGPGTGKKEHNPDFHDREIKQVDSFRGYPWNRIPGWLQQQLDCRQDGNREETLTNMVKILREKPTERNLRLALMVLNEIGRFSDGGEYLRKHITQDLLNEFLVKEELK